ncbi:peptide MFS transporter [Candidatus Halobeggiatoa sp. HSG11]|nr:peptide MFS transporter [Candidatus Halobeggiatoa sp. HSG11]
MVTYNHPKALYLLFFTEMWERFSYYGMRALLVLFLVSETSVGGLGWTSAQAGQLYGLYTGLVYMTPLIGGYLADRLLGFRYAVIIGAALMALGHGALAIESLYSFYFGLFLLVLGNGFFKPNISSMVGQLYPDNSPLKDSGYTIFYMGINVGAFLGILICGYLGEKVGWHYGFGAACIGMTFGLVLFYSLQNLLGEVGLKPVKMEKVENEPLTKTEIERLYAILILAIFSMVFWLSFEQAGSSMNIFAMQYTDRWLFGFEMPASWFQTLNPLFIFILAPFFSTLWIRLGDKNPNGPLKFALGLFLLGLGFLILFVGATSIPKGAESASISMWWLSIAILLHTTGELCLSPVGLSFVNKLSPKHFMGIMFGMWFLSMALGNYIGGLLFGMLDDFVKEQSMADFFLMFVVIIMASAVLLFALSFKIKKWMHGIR